MSSWARAATTSASARSRRTAIADTMAAALDPKTTGVAVLVDANVAERSARARELVAALARAAAARRARLDLRAGRGLQEPDGDREVVRVAGRPRLRSARRGHRHRRRRRHRPRRLRRGDLPARRAVRAGADDAARDGRRVGGRQDRRRSRRRARTWSARSTSRARCVADVGFLETLPARERIAGLAEVVKCGFIADAAPARPARAERPPTLTVAQHAAR